MRRPSFLQGVLVAAALGFFASATIATLTPFIGFGSVVRLVIPALALAYLLYLLQRSDEKVGRITTIALWCLLAAVTWWFEPPLALYFLIHVLAVWLTRALYFYSGVVPALLDLGLTALGILAATWALSRSGSVFLATWCFFLVQSLYVTIPVRLQRKRAGTQPDSLADENFERARRRADRALRQLITE